MRGEASRTPSRHDRRDAGPRDLLRAPRSAADARGDADRVLLRSARERRRGDHDRRPCRHGVQRLRGRAVLDARRAAGPSPASCWAGFRPLELLLGRLLLLEAIGMRRRSAVTSGLISLVSDPARPELVFAGIALTVWVAVPLGLAIATMIARELEGVLAAIAVVVCSAFGSRSASSGGTVPAALRAAAHPLPCRRCVGWPQWAGLAGGLSYGLVLCLAVGRTRGGCGTADGAENPPGHAYDCGVEQFSVRRFARAVVVFGGVLAAGAAGYHWCRGRGLDLRGYRAVVTVFAHGARLGRPVPMERSCSPRAAARRRGNLPLRRGGASSRVIARGVLVRSVRRTKEGTRGDRVLAGALASSAGTAVSAAGSRPSSREAGVPVRRASTSTTDAPQVAAGAGRPLHRGQRHRGRGLARGRLRRARGLVASADSDVEQPLHRALRPAHRGRSS